jgi:hypothetical protein
MIHAHAVGMIIVIRIRPAEGFPSRRQYAISIPVDTVQGLALLANHLEAKGCSKM